MRQVFEQSTAFCSKQGAVCGEHWFESLAFCCFDEFGQQWVQRGLSHKVKIQVWRFSLELVGEDIEFFLGKKLMGALRFVAERAGEIADVGYFKIYFFEHFLILLELMDIFYHKICLIAIEIKMPDKNRALILIFILNFSVAGRSQGA